MRIKDRSLFICIQNFVHIVCCYLKANLYEKDPSIREGLSSCKKGKNICMFSTIYYILYKLEKLFLFAEQMHIVILIDFLHDVPLRPI